MHFPWEAPVWMSPSPRWSWRTSSKASHPRPGRGKVLLPAQAEVSRCGDLMPSVQKELGLSTVHPFANLNPILHHLHPPETPPANERQLGKENEFLQARWCFLVKEIVHQGPRGCVIWEFTAGRCVVSQDKKKGWCW